MSYGRLFISTCVVTAGLFYLAPYIAEFLATLLPAGDYANWHIWPVPVLGMLLFALARFRFLSYPVLVVACFLPAHVVDVMGDSVRGWPLFASVGLGWWFMAYFAWHLGTAPKHIEAGETGEGVPDADVIRGTKLVRLQTTVDRKRDPEDVYLGGVPIPRGAEIKHFILAGSTGTGKSQAIHQFLRAIRNRGGRAVIADSGGDFLSKWGGGYVFNPFDERGVPWSPFAEIRQDYDCLRIAEAAIPASGGSSEQWNHYARALFSDVLLALHKKGDKSTTEAASATQLRAGRGAAAASQGFAFGLARRSRERAHARLRPRHPRHSHPRMGPPAGSRGLLDPGMGPR